MPSPLTPTSYDGQWRELGKGRGEGGGEGRGGEGREGEGEFVVITLNCAICISEVWLRGERS